MKPDWRLCKRDEGVGAAGVMYVTMNRRGYIVMNRLTHQRMDEPKAVNLLFDKTNSRIGVQPTAVTERHAFRVGKYGRHGGKLVRAYKLMQDFAIDLPETVQFRDVRIDEDGILVLDLRTAELSTRAEGQRRRKPER